MSIEDEVITNTEKENLKHDVRNKMPSQEDAKEKKVASPPFLPIFSFVFQQNPFDISKLQKSSHLNDPYYDILSPCDDIRPR